MGKVSGEKMKTRKVMSMLSKELEVADNKKGRKTNGEMTKLWLTCS